MTTYAERLTQFINFKSKKQLDEEVTKYRMTIGYQLNDTDNLILDYMKRYAVRYTGVFYQLLETIAENTGKSLATVKRVIKKLVDLGLIKRFSQRKENGRRKGATVYQFQWFKKLSEPKRMSRRESKNDASKACESKSLEEQDKNKPFIPSNKDLKDLNTYQQAENVPDSHPVDKFVPKKLTDYQRMKSLLMGAIGTPNLVYRMYGAWRGQTSKMVNKPPFDLAIEASRLLIMEMKRRHREDLTPLRSPVGYFSGILNNLINDYLEERPVEVYEEMKGAGPEYLYW